MDFAGYSTSVGTAPGIPSLASTPRARDPPEKGAIVDLADETKLFRESKHERNEREMTLPTGDCPADGHTDTVAKKRARLKELSSGHERSLTRSFRAPQIWAGGRAERRDGDGVITQLKEDTLKLLEVRRF
ncbi:hypothetical protein THAOC_23451 [Thalassiosira oceanica]|uniref:Uncharacterized protein n=1 Tax=Thalassiosira oceanica TaxID=159749 RepID=K0RUI5_THAOC|nr:hypothetical protein THAOC_23451 [Thalassiosira oceanica]|eukprot:EJK56625.1 hypothetical protein THAOC_23451 [Thalassiosira oceanica]